MSTFDLLADLLKDARGRAITAIEVSHQLNTQLIKHQAAHRSLLAHLRMAADDLETAKPRLSKRYREVADSWEEYCEKPQQSLGEVADPTPSGPAYEAESDVVPEAPTQLESPVGLPVSHSSPGAYAGEWDEVKS